MKRKIDPIGPISPIGPILSSPLVFDIARGSFVDGPGIRTVVFFKGCPLRCVWCQNPESQHPGPEVLFYPEYCIKCDQCKSGCNSMARRTAGQYYPPGKLARMILRDETFYHVSNGGVTFSGGEPLLYIDYIHETVNYLDRDTIHIAVETCGHFDFKKLEKGLLSRIDLFLFDIKIMDTAAHEAYTGKSNERILRNFKTLREAGAEVLPRVPLVPGFTATEENLSRVADFFVEQGVERYSFLPYNPSGLKKWERLGKKPPGDLSPRPMTLEEEREWVAFFNARFK